MALHYCHCQLQTKHRLFMGVEHVTENDVLHSYTALLSVTIFGYLLEYPTIFSHSLFIYMGRSLKDTIENLQW